MKLMIWSDTIPAEHRYFLTPGKRYEANRNGEFLDDEGDEVCAALGAPSNLLYGGEWRMSRLDRLRLRISRLRGRFAVWRYDLRRARRAMR